MLVRIGDVEIWRILESVDPFMLPDEFFVGVSKDDLPLFRQAAPRQLCPETGKLLFPIQGFLLRTPQHVVLIDACVGNDKTCDFFKPWHKRTGERFIAALAAAGVGPADVDYVMCTHLHPDHVGWNTRLENGRWVPTFPNARYILQEVDHADVSADAGHVYRESVLPVVEAGQAELVATDHTLGDHISLLPTPGHTHGHVSVRIRDGDAEALITGDALHSPTQCLRPEWNYVHDLDKPRATLSRRSLLEQASERDQLVLGSHFPLPSIGSVLAMGDAFVWRER